jgi:pyridinium-3,5-bisthiocarboxylic acid mononucleotide nickel chelatase
MATYKKTTLRLIECNLDDMNPEYFPYITERLFAAGARDVWLKPIIMKGGRPANCYSVLCEHNKELPICELLFSETTTLGLRVSSVERYELERDTKVVETTFGRIPVKVAYDENGRVLNAAPEFSACRDLAQANSAPLKEVYDGALAAWRKSR